MLNIRQVLVPTCRNLVFFQVFQINKVDFDAIDFSLDAGFVAYVKFHTRRGGDQVNTARRITELNDLIGDNEIFLPQTKRSKPKLIEGLDDIGSIFRLYITIPASQCG